MQCPDTLHVSGNVTLHVIELPSVIKRPTLRSTASESTVSCGADIFSIDVRDLCPTAAVLFVPPSFHFRRLRVLRSTLVVRSETAIQSSTEIELLDGAIVFVPRCSLRRLSLTCGQSDPSVLCRQNSFVAMGDVSCDTLTVHCSAPAILSGLVVRESADTQLLDSAATVHLAVSRLTKLTATGLVQPQIETPLA